MTFQVTILGCSSARPTVSRYHTAHVLNVHEQFFLIDCGEGTQYQLMRYGINPLKLNHIFISHLHGDHAYGIFGLLATMGMMGRHRPLKVFAPAPFAEMIEMHLKAFSVTLPYEFQVAEVDTTQHRLICENRAMEVYTIPLRHRVPCCGYLFREKRPELNVKKDKIAWYGLDPLQIVALKRGESVELDDGRIVESSAVTYLPYEPRSYAFCSDTTASGKVKSLVQGVDLLYHETTFMHEDKKLAVQTGHTTALQAGKVAAEAGVRYLVTGHYSARYKNLQPLLDEARSEFPDTILGEDGLVLNLDKEHLLTISRK